MPGVRPRVDGPRVERAGVATEAFQAERGGDVSMCKQPPDVGGDEDPHADRRGVRAGQRQAILGAKRDRRQAGLGQRLARRQPPAMVLHLTQSQERQRRVRHRRQVGHADRSL